MVWAFVDGMWSVETPQNALRLPLLVGSRGPLMRLNVWRRVRQCLAVEGALCLNFSFHDPFRHSQPLTCSFVIFFSDGSCASAGRNVLGPLIRFYNAPVQ